MSDDDLAALNEYRFVFLEYCNSRQKRIQELQKAAEKNKFGYLISISRSEYIRQVTECSQEYPVVVFLYNDRYPLKLCLVFPSLSLSLIVRF